jgi:2-phospho-L-lactate/phosphoenolpyruvate guanylyltransferase
MDICAIIPVKSFHQAKSRLSILLDIKQRIELSQFLLQDTLNALSLCHELAKIIVVASDPLVKEITQNLGLECLIQSEDYGVNSAVRYADKFLSTSGSWASITIPCDLPLLLPKDIDSVCQLIPKVGACVIICPSFKFDGTNLLARNPFNIIGDTRYDNASFHGHLEASIGAGANTKVLLSTRLMIDLDTPEDLRLVLTKNASTKKSISYLWKIKKNHFG